MTITLLTEEPKWRSCRGLASRLRDAVEIALRRGGGKSGTVAILLADDARLRMLNARFRGQDKPTNVLSFPSTEKNHIGDVAIAYGVAAKQAREESKTLNDHALHLAVHGVLHLLGYDHKRARDAGLMEALEIAILAELGVADPYAKRALPI